MENRFVVSIGSNSIDAADNVRHAIDFLSGYLDEFQCSSIYSTPSIKNDGTMYHNAVAMGVTDLSEDKFNSILKSYESGSGRKHGDSCVEIDLDIVVANGEVIRPKDFSRNYFIIGYNELE